MKLSKVTRPVRSKALDLHLSVSKAPVSCQWRAESGQGQQWDKMTKMETRGLRGRTVVSWTRGEQGRPRGWDPAPASARPAGLVLAPSPCL